MHDYTAHLGSCKVQAWVNTRASASSPAAKPPAGSLPSPSASSSAPAGDWAHITGAFQALAPWASRDAGALAVHQGSTLWVNSADDSGEWAYAQLLPQGRRPGQPEPAPAWVPRALLQP